MAKLVHHGTSSARLLLAQVFAILQQRGKTEVVAEVARTLVRQSLTECRGSVLRPLSAAEHSPEGCSQPKKVLARKLTTVTAIPTPLTASQTVKRSLALLERSAVRSHLRFSWSDPMWWAR
jgi:hypothetical protein